MKINSDFLVIGSGIAGLTFAIKASEYGHVAIVTKNELQESSTYYAQGGIAGVFSEEDSFESHIKDTINAGAGLCNVEAVNTIVKEGPSAIEDLINMGTEFTRSDYESSNNLDLTKEGGHSTRRIVHAKDKTGKEVQRSLIENIRGNKNISIYENHIAIDLISADDFAGSDEDKEKINDRIIGAYILDIEDEKIHTFTSKSVIIAAGGAGKAYLYTSNPDVSTGDGIAMAFRAGAEIANMEFTQFHPTCLFHSEAKSFLISEALRGEGARLILKSGKTFTEKYDKRGDLAPRDIVARAIDFELKKSGQDCVYLDISFKDSEFIKTRFPQIYERCMELSIDITKEPIPVVPAAHYMCGGIKTDLKGQSSIKGLYAIGESSCTGVHGANRLASNSLLESLVMAKRAAKYAAEELKEERLPFIKAKGWQKGEARKSEEAVIVSQNWDEIRRIMWNYVGIVRSDKRLSYAQERINLLEKEINDYYWDFRITKDLTELRNITDIAKIIVMSALKRKESRGIHYNIDHPKKDDKNFKKDTVLIKDN